MLIDFHIDKIDFVEEITTEISSHNKEVDLTGSSKVPTIMFGVGPVLDKETRIRIDQAHALPGNEDVPFWSDNLAKAASILYKHNAAEEFFVMGGRTGGSQYASESEIIRKKMKNEIPSDIIRIEDQSYDTPTNLIHFLNEYTSEDAPITEPTVDLLGISSHLNRIRAFAKIFAIPVRNAFAAEEVMRYQARKNPQGVLDSTQWNNEELQEIEDMLNMKTPSSFLQISKVSNSKSMENERFLIIFGFVKL